MLDIFGQSPLFVMSLLMIWVLPWKGWALWLAARRKEKWWFIALLVINTLAILEIFYIFVIAKKSDVTQENNTSESTEHDN